MLESHRDDQVVEGDEAEHLLERRAAGDLLGTDISLPVVAMQHHDGGERGDLAAGEAVPALGQSGPDHAPGVRIEVDHLGHVRPERQLVGDRLCLQRRPRDGQPAVGEDRVSAAGQAGRHRRGPERARSADRHRAPVDDDARRPQRKLALAEARQLGSRGRRAAMRGPRGRRRRTVHAGDRAGANEDPRNPGQVNEHLVVQHLMIGPGRSAPGSDSGTTPVSVSRCTAKP